MITSSYPTGDSPAAGRFVAELADALEDAGNEVMVAAPASADADEDQARSFATQLSAKSGVFYGPGIEQNLKSNPFRVFPLTMDVLKALPKLSLMATMSDMVMVHWLYPYGVAVARMRRLWNRPIVVVLHSVSPMTFRFSPFTRRAVENTDLFVAVSETTRKNFLAALSKDTRTIAAPKTKVIPLGTMPRVGVLRQGDQETLRVLFLGRLVKIKGPDIAVNAVRGLRNISLTLAGTGPMYKNLKKQADLENTDFIGAVHPDAVADLMNRHDCLVLPSRRLFGGRQEGMPMVLKEAATTGLPAIVSPFGSPVGFIEEYKCGEVLPSLDSASLAKMLTGLRDHPELLTRLSEQALQAAESFTWPRILPMWTSALERL